MWGGGASEYCRDEMELFFYSAAVVACDEHKAFAGAAFFFAGYYADLARGCVFYGFVHTFLHNPEDMQFLFC